MKRIIILGGGFAGVKCASTLRRELSPTEAEVVLFNTENHLVFTPLLADAIGASVNPLDVVVPLRQLVRGVACRTEEVLNLDQARQIIHYRNSDGFTCQLEFDHLVLACGNVANLHAVPGMADHAFPLKNIADAIALRSHVMEQMERAETCQDAERRRWHLSFIVVGGGFSGVEAAGEINDLVRSSARYFQNFRPEDASVTLVHSRDQILPEIGIGLREFARQRMEHAGVRFLLDATVSAATAEGVALGDGRFLPGGTVICTVGSSPSPLLERLSVPKEKGRVLTGPEMRVRGAPNLWATGDCSLITNGYDGKLCPPTAQFAERQGHQCALNIARTLRGEATRPFVFQPLGQLCSIGGHSAVAELFGFQLSGLAAWFLWRSVYLFKLPSWSRRLQVAFDWAWLFLFPRDLTHLRSRPTERVGHAHYQPGDIVLHQGESPSCFFVIEDGEAEWVRPADASGPEEIVRTLGPGSFLGEKALLGDEPMPCFVRARTPLKVLVLGRNIFRQISTTLAPLHAALAETLNPPSVDLQRLHHRARAPLEGAQIRELASPLPASVHTATHLEFGEAPPRFRPAPAARPVVLEALR